MRNVTGVRQTVRLTGRYGAFALDFGVASIAPHRAWNAAALVSIAHPRLWSIDHPALYRATLTLSDKRHRRVGGFVTYSGIRSITVKRGRLMLNGRALNLRGAEFREQDLQLGGALDPAHLQRLVAWVRALGATVIRSDPLNPQIAEMADRDGILLWSDIPVTQQFSNLDPSQPTWPASALSLLKQNILANENHPSLLVWNIANELPSPSTSAEGSYIARAAALAHRLDPGSLASMAVGDWPGLPCDPAYAPLDVIGLNEYFGWYDVGGGATDDRDALSPFLDSVRACYPTKALFVSEFGFDANRDGPVEERGTYQLQADAAAFHLGVFASKPWLSGAIYFLLQDSVAYFGYTGGNPWPDPPFLHKGLLDFQGHPKPAWQVVADIYRATTQIAPALRGAVSTVPSEPSYGDRATRSSAEQTVRRSRDASSMTEPACFGEMFDRDYAGDQPLAVLRRQVQGQDRHQCRVAADRLRLMPGRRSRLRTDASLACDVTRQAFALNGNKSMLSASSGSPPTLSCKHPVSRGDTAIAQK